MKILVLEDNVRLCNLIANALNKEGFRVDTFIDGEDALEVLGNGYQCFVLDINVPSLDGISILETIRLFHKDVPVIIISSNHELDKIQHSYEVGCDDYLKKPFFMYELVHKIKKLCHVQSQRLDLGCGFVLDMITRKVFSQENEVVLAKKEILFLELLSNNLHRIVSFEEIEEYVWEGESTTLINIRALVKRLRKKIPEDSVKIVKGLGYGLSSSVKFL